MADRQATAGLSPLAQAVAPNLKDSPGIKLDTVLVKIQPTFKTNFYLRRSYAGQWTIKSQKEEEGEDGC